MPATWILVVTTLRYGAFQEDPCGGFRPLEELRVSYNSRPNGVFRAGVPADSLG